MSYDSKEEHIAFRQKYKLTTPLLMDTDKSLGQAYGLGDGAYAARKTFVIAKDGTLAAIIDSINFDDHASQILSAIH